MGRKSRNILNNDNIEIVNNTQCQLTTGVYARLSVENSGKSEEKDAIINQIEICKNYVNENPELKLHDVYIDNGKTGTVFDRPEFNRLMDDVKAGKVKVVVVRELARFGRDYVETGTFIERIFPMLGVRFIAIKENFDTSKNDLTNESLMIPLQNMINELYSKDISKKVATALRTKIKNGEYRAGNLPYGYIWNEDRSKIIVDELTAPFVQLIFKLKIDGISIPKMIEKLTELNAPNTEQRKRETGVGTGTGDKCEGWYKTTLYGILTNPIYTGNTYSGKTVKSFYKGEKERKVDKADWYVFENTHEAIISQEDFETVEKIMINAAVTKQQKMELSEKARKKLIDFFDGKIFCADCGRRMHFLRKKLDYSKCKVKKEVWHTTYVCSTNNRRLTPKCTSHSVVQKKLNEQVLDVIKTQVRVATDYEMLIKKLAKTKKGEELKGKQTHLISSLTLKINSIQEKRARLYDDFATKILNEEEYLFAKEKYDAEFSKLNLLFEEATKRQSEYNSVVSSKNDWIKLMKSVSKAKKLTQTLVDKTIERINVYDGGNIEVVMKYNDIYELTILAIAELTGGEHNDL